ncbi:hypothetical protein FKM82_022088 [Ascaphus truei]
MAGPFEVLRRTGDVDYEIAQPGSRKGKQIYHVNLLKPWKVQRSLFIQSVEEETDLCPQPPRGNIIGDEQIPMGRQLSPEKKGTC